MFFVRERIVTSFFIIILFYASLSHAQRVPEITKTAAAEAEALKIWLKDAGPKCGANSLYVFLRLLGITVAIEKVEAYVTTVGKGASMQELCNASHKLGINAKPVVIPLEGLREYTPCILHVSNGKINEGHYLVLANLSLDEAMVIDGTTGAFSIASVKALAKAYSGHAIIFRKSNGIMGFPYFVSSCLFFECCILGFLMRASRKVH